MHGAVGAFNMALAVCRLGKSHRADGGARIPQETNESDQFQSLLQGWINCPSVSENIPDPLYSLNAAVGREKNNSVDLNTKVVGFLKDSEEKKLSDEDLSPETSLCLDAFLEELVMFPKEQILQEIFPQVLEDCQRTNMTVIDRDNTPHEASMEGHYRIASELLEAGADVNARGSEEITPLQDAVREDHYEVEIKRQLNYVSPHLSKISLIVPDENPIWLESAKKGALISHVAYQTRAWAKKRSAKGENQLHIAAMRGDLSLVKTLISSGICVNEKDNAGLTAIHEASVRGFTEVMLELLKTGANINCRSRDGILPIHDAVSGNYLEAVRILLQHGANPHERDDFGKNALDKACDDEMRELLNMSLMLPYKLQKQKELLLLKLISSKDAEHGELQEGVVPEPEHKQASGEKEAQWARIRREALGAGPVEVGAAIGSSVLACPVIFDTNNGVQHRPTEYSVSKEIHQAVKDYGLKAPYTAALIQGTSEDQCFTPHDHKMLARLLLTLLWCHYFYFYISYRASVESFRKRALRELVKLASRQKSLLIVAQNQKELVQKIQNYRKEKQVFATHSKKPISDTVICCGNSKGQDLTADKVTCPGVVTFSTGPGASMPNGNRVEAHLSLENRFSAQECSQHPNSCLAERANKEAIRSKEVSDHAFASENGIREYPFISWQVNKSLNPTSVTNTLNISEARSAVVSNNISQPTSYCTLVTNTDYPINLSRKSSQSSSSQQCEHKQLKCKGNKKKKIQLIDLLQLGRIKPGENVLEFKLQITGEEYSHKASLLENGKIKISDRILQNPVQWVKELLGNDISVTWKYVWNKVTYLGMQLSKFLVEEVSVSNDLELPSQQREPVGLQQSDDTKRRKVQNWMPVATAARSRSVNTDPPPNSLEEARGASGGTSLAKAPLRGGFRWEQGMPAYATHWPHTPHTEETHTGVNSRTSVY
ncbi:LOW QUALITY PROTEIN: ankyrin repeat domain-containing protein 31-like [Eudromia elegans]